MRQRSDTPQVSLKEGPSEALAPYTMKVTWTLQVYCKLPTALYFFNILFCGFLGSFGPYTEEPGVGTGNAETGKCLKVLPLLCDDSGFLLLIDVRMSIKGPVS